MYAPDAGLENVIAPVAVDVVLDAAVLDVVVVSVVLDVELGSLVLVVVVDSVAELVRMLEVVGGADVAALILMSIP